jgi:hypothetical protein
VNATLKKLFPRSNSDILIFTATGIGKVSWRVVFPTVIVEGKTASRARNAAVEALCLASMNESTDLFIREISAILKCLDAKNEWRNVLDETSLSGRYGLRLVLCDKLTDAGTPEQRPMVPLIWLTNELKIKVINTPANLREFLRNGAVRVSEGLELSYFEGSDVRRTRMTRTGPGGSCADVEAFQKLSQEHQKRNPMERAKPLILSRILYYSGDIQQFKQIFKGITEGKWSEPIPLHYQFTFRDQFSAELYNGCVTLKANNNHRLESLVNTMLKVCSKIPPKTNTTIPQAPTVSYSKVEVIRSFYSVVFAVGVGEKKLQVIRIHEGRAYLRKPDKSEGWVPISHLALM